MSKPSKKPIVIVTLATCVLYMVPLLPGQTEPGAGAVPTVLPGDVADDWWALARRNIQQSEYHVTWQEQTYLADVPAAYQAPNRAHNLRTYFTPEGIRVIPRRGDPAAWQWGLTLAGYGYEGDISSPAADELVTNGNRIEYRRGALCEWYVNAPRGLEQGFTLGVSPPTGRAAGFSLRGAPTGDAFETHGVARVEARGSLRIDMMITGDLQGTLRADGQGIEFTTRDGVRVIDYGELKVVDATLRELPARFALAGERLSILVDDAGAVYPVTIDPLATSPNWTAESDQAHAWFGDGVATAGDVNADGYADVIVGARDYDNGQTDEGRAYVYHGSPTGLSPTADWTAEGNQASAFFGHSVATAGDVNADGYADVIVGAFYWSNGETHEGRAYVYHGSASGVSATADWTAEGNQAGAYFGSSVATAGDVNGDGYGDVVVGAGSYDNGQTDEGRAFVYHGSASGLSPTADWTAESDQDSAWFGWSSVGTAGDVNGDGYSDVIIGAHLYDNGEFDEGAAFVYQGSAGGLSTTADWTADSDYSGAWFGSSVATAGDVNGDGYADVIVGAHGYGSPEMWEGRAFVYYGSPGGLSLAADWTAESNQAEAYFGHSVATAGDVNGDGYADVIVGAPNYYDNGQTYEGWAFVYHGSASGLDLGGARPTGDPNNADWTAESDQANAEFGHSVATAGDVNGDGYADVIVGARFYDNGQTNEGRAYVYHGSPGGLSTTAGWTAESDQVNAMFGECVATAGDVNGDGYADVIVGAYNFDNGQTNEGRAFVYHGSAAGLSTTADWTAESDQAETYFGTALATAGDVNGDGYADVIVGAHYYDNGQVDEGRAFVYHGSATGLSATADWTVESDQAYAYLGNCVATAGDVNGDGYADVIVGVFWYNTGRANEGRALVYHGSATGLSPTAKWTAESDQASAQFGQSVATAGDVNGDGYADVIVGAHWYSNGQEKEGGVFVYHGSATGLSPTADWTAESDQAGAEFGWSVATAGDVNGDGYADVVVGARYYDAGQTDEGRAFVYHGSTAGLSLSADWTAESDQAYAAFGISAATAGDVNGDGYADVVVGAWYYDNGQTNEGRAFVYHGSATGLSPTADWTAESDQYYAFLGLSVATAGDVNGDGYADVIVGAHYYDNGQENEGRAFMYYGNDGPGLSLEPRQRRSDDSAPIAHLGASDNPVSFRLAALGRTPFGRGFVKLEWEVKPLGTLFDGTGTEQSASWYDTGTAGAELSELVSGLSVNTMYHWRVRLLYDPATTPFQQHSRWFTMPWNGWEEADLRTNPFTYGDLNCDGSLNSLDIDPFVLALTATPPKYLEYYAEHPDCDHTLADCNHDGSINSLDTDPFVDLLTAG